MGCSYGCKAIPDSYKPGGNSSSRGSLHAKDLAKGGALPKDILGPRNMRVMSGAKHSSLGTRDYLGKASGNYANAVERISRPAPSLELNYGGLARPYQ